MKHNTVSIWASYVSLHSDISGALVLTKIQGLETFISSESEPSTN